MKKQSPAPNITSLIEAAITMAGSEAKLGKLAGFSQNAIWYAKRNGRCSAELAIGIEVATKGAIDRSRLRPDLFSPEIEASVSRERSAA